MKFLPLGLLLTFGQVSAQEMTVVKADYRCEQAGGGIAIKVGTRSTARVWQTEQNDDVGLELKVTDFRKEPCLNCFSFDALLMGVVQVRGQVKSSVLTYQVYDNGWETVLTNVQCVSTK